MAHQVEVLILQHPLERDQAKGSARLLHLSLARSRLLTGEVFVADEWLAAPHSAQAAAAGTARHNLLLYPDSPAGSTPTLPQPPVLAPELLQHPAQLRLVVLDGTWRKSRKMLYLNPQLQRLPRLSLQDMPASNYHIRRAHQPDQLSTLEAVCAALAQLEGDTGQFRPLLKAFDGFVAQQMGYQGGQVLTP